LGVPWDAVREDYLLSNKYREDEVKKRLAQLRQLLAKKQDLPPENVDVSNIEAFYVQKGEYIDATRDEILKQYGSIEGYLTQGLGLSADEIAKLRERLLQ
jgi:protein-tyrosine phosphatase